MVAERRLTNVRMLPLQPQNAFANMLAASDLLMLVQRAGVTDAVVPSKLLSYMAAGRAVCVSADQESEAARIVRRAGCGAVVLPEDPAALAAAIRSMTASPAALAEMGSRGRLHVRRFFAKPIILERYRAFLEASVRVRGGTVEIDPADAVDRRAQAG